MPRLMTEAELAQMSFDDDAPQPEIGISEIIGEGYELSVWRQRRSFTLDEFAAFLSGVRIDRPRKMWPPETKEMLRSLISAAICGEVRTREVGGTYKAYRGDILTWAEGRNRSFYADELRREMVKSQRRG